MPLQPLWQEHRVGVELHCPVMLQVPLMVADPAPDTLENLGVHPGVSHHPRLALGNADLCGYDLCVHHALYYPCLLVTEHCELLAIEDPGTCAGLSPHQLQLIGVRHENREAIERGAVLPSAPYLRATPRCLVVERIGLIHAHCAACFASGPRWVLLVATHAWVRATTARPTVLPHGRACARVAHGLRWILFRRCRHSPCNSRGALCGGGRGSCRGSHRGCGCHGCG
mmetsp:Transcript_20686/g.44062  ORF Transcript_20686/g.44062 Transcript_20686/m.44062 type:complete len:227 (+) Transcript_20686:582-1262(+)